MGRARTRCRYAHTLFNLGSMGGLPDGELLGLFAARRDEAGELAFALLVERHGPMVLRVCRSILRDEHDAQDAVQATFLVLVRRGGTVRNRGSIGSWLHGVALRVAACARVSAGRRWVRERRAALARVELSDETSELGLAEALHEELDRLPERHRAVIVLCYLEGLACEAAASRLRVPVGTVKSRLARGRERLRAQLIRRGFAPSTALFAPAGWLDGASQTIPPRVVESIARTAVGIAAGDQASAGAVSAWIASVAGRVLLAMSLRSLARVAGVVLLLGAASIGFAAFAQKTSADRPRAQAAGKKEAPRDPAPARVRPESVIDDALRAADQIPIPWAKAHALADIATVQAKLGQAEPSRATFRRAAEMIEGNRDNKASLHTAQLAWLAKAQATAGDRAGARATIGKIIDLAQKLDDERDRSRALDNAARWQAQGGNPEGAIALLDAIKEAPASMRAYTLSEIGGAQSAAGDLPGARATMARALAEAERAEKEPGANNHDAQRALDAMRLAQVRGMAPFARAQAKAGDVEGARATLARARVIADRVHADWRPAPLAELARARVIPDRVRADWRPAPLAEIAMAYRVAGDEKKADEALKEALAIAMGFPDAGQRIEQLARIAIIQAESGDRKSGRETYDQALRFASQNPPMPGSLAYQCLSGAKARVGDWSGAREFALGQTDWFLRAMHAEGACFEQAKAGEARDALVWAEGQTDPINRARALLGVVRGMMEQPPKG